MHKSLIINWILRAPIAARGGGYRTIFRLANYLGSVGHQVRVYIEPIAHLSGLSVDQIVNFTHENFGPLHLNVFVGHQNILPADVMLATNWPTAYTVAAHQQSVYKFYFVQDFEPEFYEKSDQLYESALQTYELPLQYITIGDYLAKRLYELNGRTAETIPFGIDSHVFNATTKPSERTGNLRVLFFARPGLKRRGYEIGVSALEILKKHMPEVEIVFFGAPSEELGNVPFEYTNLGVLAPEQLVIEMNRSHIMLSLSLSNISWVPFEGMACGLAVVEADVPSVRHMIKLDKKIINLAPPTADGLSTALLRLCKNDELRINMANLAVDYINKHGLWSDSCEKFEKILVERCIL
jgi:glycosyltransferase involved in cell wall biosynthesis